MKRVLSSIDQLQKVIEEQSEFVTELIWGEWGCTYAGKDLLGTHQGFHSRALDLLKIIRENHGSLE